MAHNPGWRIIAGQRGYGGEYRSDQHVCDSPRYTHIFLHNFYARGVMNICINLMACQQMASPYSK
ncbi:Uncharacterised protein [Mycobacteroides abscessus subsp. abscessus]|nr:Uncharacterised protein [Mycobacteroides abscessus subsp. abscessus]SIH54345.1 Uncharacterised protein [Mycobacteroides abscessus subsp. abscessus]SIK80041.1 Uncharacterised protein [Mycobacteroides abscessus subsp. abscessus]